MKRIALLVFALFAAFVVYAQCDIESYIVDPDGYVNVRSNANSKANIVTTLNSGTTVYYEYNSNSNWYRIALEKFGTPLGYIHSSRLVSAKSTDSADDSATNSTLNIVVKEPGNILKYLPMDKLSDIISLTISGQMYETDVAIIKMCTNLQYLNLANAIISDSPEMWERRENANIKGKYPHMPNCYIPESAFEKMNLRAVVLPKNVKLIDCNAFYGCVSLKKVDLGEALMIIENNAFANTQLEEISFPKTLKVIYNMAFDNVQTLKVFDLSRCTITDISSLYGKNDNIGYHLINLEKYYMPNGTTTCEAFLYFANDIKYFFPKLKDYYVGKDVKLINEKIKNICLHFQSSQPPSIGYGEVSNCTIFVPQNGNLTSYYAVFNNNGNKIIQE